MLTQYIIAYYDGDVGVGDDDNGDNGSDGDVSVVVSG